MFDHRDYGGFSVVGPGAQSVCIACGGQEAQRTLRIRTLCRSDNFPAVRASLNSSEPMGRGEVFLAHFRLRALESLRESGDVGVQFEVQNTDTDAISVQFAAYAASVWQEFWVPFRLVHDAEAGAISINFRVGEAVQELELCDISVEHCTQGTRLDQLLATPVIPSYEGMAENAPWRRRAEEAIRTHRMAPLQIAVLKEDGTPHGGARLHVEQKRHAYWFGSAVQAERLAGENREEAYAADVKRLFNAVVLENDLKWNNWIINRQRAIDAVRWCRENNFAVRGHTLLWPTRRRIPETLLAVADSGSEALRQLIRDHIDDITTATSGSIDAWDVVNEPFRNNDIIHQLGEAEMGEWFRRAAAAAPRSRLFLNDYGIVTGGGMDERHQDYCERTLQSLLQSGAPLHGLGVQGHFGRILTPPPRMHAVLERYGRLGLDIQMTEYSTHFDDGELVAGYLHDVLTVFFSHPSTSAFMLWCFGPGGGFDHTSLLTDTEGELTAAGRVWTELIYDTWWTCEEVVTDADGRASLNVFHGLHEVSLRQGGELLPVAQIDVGKAGAVLAVSSAGGKHAGNPPYISRD